MLPNSLNKLVQTLSRLPGVGEKTALRFALYMLLQRPALVGQLELALCEARERLTACERCGNLAEKRPEGETLCSLCRDDRRDKSVLCVIARIQDLLAIERSGAMRGRYFVLGKLLSPLDGIGIEDLPIERLRQRIKRGPVEELVIATPPSVDGEATALCIAQEFGSQLRVTRIASGVPHGGELEFADPVTLGRALSGRRTLGE